MDPRAERVLIDEYRCRKFIWGGFKFGVAVITGALITLAFLRYLNGWIDYALSR